MPQFDSYIVFSLANKKRTEHMLNRNYLKKLDATEMWGSRRKKKVSTAIMESKADKNKFLDIIALIRSIQRSEGHTDCFRKGLKDCDQLDCAWRHLCLEGYDDFEALR